jgi:hypothetical protein
VIMKLRKLSWIRMNIKCRWKSLLFLPIFKIICDFRFFKEYTLHILPRLMFLPEIISVTKDILTGIRHEHINQGVFCLHVGLSNAQSSGYCKNGRSHQHIWKWTSGEFVFLNWAYVHFDFSTVITCIEAR